MVASLAIVGAGGHGKVAADIAGLNGWANIHFYDDNPGVQGTSVQSCQVVGGVDELKGACLSYEGIFIAIGDNKTRRNHIELFSSEGANIVNLFHPTAVVSNYSRLGDAIIVMPGGVVNAGATIGSGTIINTNASVDHDCLIGQSVHISPGVSLGGGVKVGDCSWVGLNVSVKQNVVLGSGVVVGAGAAVVRDLPDNVVAVGVPAKIIKNTISNT
jgi:sugar O-acyltransferase (sialic acid O-acetyltransferase NeuD family)